MPLLLFPVFSLNTPLEKKSLETFCCLLKRPLTTRGPWRTEQLQTRSHRPATYCRPRNQIYSSWLAETGAALSQYFWSSCALTLTLDAEAEKWCSLSPFLLFLYVFSLGWDWVWSERVYCFHMSERRLQNHPWAYWGLHLLVNPLQRPQWISGWRTVPQTNWRSGMRWRKLCLLLPTA